MSNDSLPERVEAKHREALAAGKEFYFDPDTGFMVMTELHHLARGECCGNDCRHCPFTEPGESDSVQR